MFHWSKHVTKSAAESAEIIKENLSILACVNLSDYLSRYPTSCSTYHFELTQAQVDRCRPCAVDSKTRALTIEWFFSSYFGQHIILETIEKL